VTRGGNQILRDNLTAAFILLNRRTGYISKRTEYTAVSLFWF